MDIETQGKVKGLRARLYMLSTRPYVTTKEYIKTSNKLRAILRKEYPTCLWYKGDAVISPDGKDYNIVINP